MAQYEVRRVQAQLDRTERTLHAHRESLALGDPLRHECCMLTDGGTAEHARILEIRHRELTDRLRVLADDDAMVS